MQPSIVFQDVVIHTNGGIFGKDGLVAAFGPITDRIQLADDLWVGRLEGADAKTIMDLCDSKDLKGRIPTRQFSQLYAFVREQEESTAGFIHDWDADNRLQNCIALSRLIHPTSVGYTYAARLRRDEHAIVDAFPATLHGVGIEGWLSPSHKRDWLTDKEAHDLAKLMKIMFTQDTLPSRLRRAMWYHEYAARTYYADLRWTLICTALESLIHTERHSSTRQFAMRVAGLANELGLTFTEDMGYSAYDLRSSLTHGQHFLSEISSEAFLIYDTMEHIVRSVILKSVSDSAFAEKFSSDDHIQNCWPVP